MSQTTTTELQDRAETITTHLDEIATPASDDASAVKVGHTRQEIEQRLDELVAHRVPADEAVRTVVRGLVSEAGLEQSDLPPELARLAGYSAGSRFERVLLDDVEEADQWIDVVAEVVDLWEPRSETIAQVGLLGEESGRLKFVKWESADLPKLVEGETYRFQNVVTDEYQGRYSVSLNSATVVEPSETAVSAAAEGVTIGGTIVDVQEGSGLIKRCPEADCTRVLSGGRCAEHGAVEGEFDLRIKAVVDDGSRLINAIFDAEATAAVSGISLNDAIDMAMDALSTDVVAEEISARLLGRRYQLTGRVVGTYFLVNEATETTDAPDGFDAEAVEPALTTRQPARRLFAEELNRTTQTFQESDEERAPVYGLTPTGVDVNRVFVVGTLIETADVGSDSEYWRGKVFAADSPVYVYASNYQPEAMAALKAAEPPMYVAVVGKLRTYERGDRTNVAIEPESITEVDEATRDSWVVETANQTRKRLNAFETGDAPFGEEATVAYGEDVSAIEAAVKSMVKP